MLLGLFLKGFLAGAIVSVPIGPMGILCIKNAIQRGRIHGFFSGLGAATCDALYAAIISFGLTFVSDFMTQNEDILRILSGLIICAIGCFIALSRPKAEEMSTHGSSTVNSFMSTFLLSFTNPLIILTFIGLFTVFGVGYTSMNAVSAILLVIGVFVGSASWWVVFATKINFGRIKVDFDTPSIRTGKFIIGVVLFIAGIITIFADGDTLDKVAHMISGIFK